MGLFNRRKTDTFETIEVTNAVNVNQVDHNAYCKPFGFYFNGRGKQDFASLFIYAVLERIYNGIRNVTFTTTETDILGEEINRFVDKNAELLLWSYFKRGYMCVIDDNGKLRLPKQNELKFDQYGQILNKTATAIYSNPYIIERDTHITIVQPFLKNINKNLNNLDFITDNCGLYGILSGKSIPISPASKAEVQEKLRKDYGNEDGKFNFILSNSEVSFTPINIPVKDLEIVDKVNSDMRWICDFFQINPDLLFGGSTFSNQAEAYRAFYRDCVTPLAEKILLLARALYVRMSKTIKPSTVMTYNLNNIPEMNRNLSERCDELGKYLDYLLRLKDAGLDVSEQLERLRADSDNLMEV